MYSLRHAALVPSCIVILATALTEYAEAQTGDQPGAPQPNEPTANSARLPASPNAGISNSTAAPPLNNVSGSPEGDFEIDARPPTSAPTSSAPASSTAATNVAASTQPANSSPPLAAAVPAPAGATQVTVAQPPAAPAPAPAADPIVNISGYGQFQYEAHQDSEDQLRQGGLLLNQDRFSVRRLRIELSRRFQYSGYFVEIDGNTTNGPALALMRAEGSLFYQGDPNHQPALVELTLGQLKVPFGFELPESSRTRWFMERSTASKAFFPSEVDVGARLSGAWKFLRYALALTNGEPKGTKATAFQLQDPNAAKDFVMRIGADARPSDAFQVTFGVSYLTGKGFAGGQDATKSRVIWNDVDQDGKVAATELTGVSGIAAIPAHNFRRWAVGGDLRLIARSPLGWTTAFGEAVAAMNLDRGLFVADPVTTTYDLREWGWHVGVMQEITPYALIGFRFDNYDPDSDLLDKRGGQFLPNSQAIATYSPLVGVTIPDRARLIFQYDIVRDHLGRDNVGAPTDLANNQWTLRLQVNL